MPKHSLQFEAIGTQWSIETDHPLSGALQSIIYDRIEDFDKIYSRFRKDSLVSMIAKQKGAYTFPEDANELFGFYETLYELTYGKVTPLIGNTLEKAGYDADYCFVSQQQQPIPKLYEAIERRGTSVEVKIPVILDVGAAGKGYLVDLVCVLLDNAGIEEYVVDASGDMRHRGSGENKVGLEHPFDPTKAIGIIDVMNGSLCASASNRRRWGNDQHHIFDPDLLVPTNEVVATWVLADSTMVADGLATALFFSDPNVLRKEFAYEYVRMHADGAIDYSPAFEGKLF